MTEAGPGARADLRREQILAAVLGCLGDGGFDAVSMRAVAERARVPLGSLHYYFSGKDEMVAAALASSVDRLADGIMAGIDLSLSPRRRLRQLLSDTLPRLCADPTTVPVYIGFWSWCQREPGRRALYHRVATGIQERVSRLVDEGCRAGEFRVADADAAATLLVSALLGFLLDHHGDPGGVPSELTARLLTGLEMALGVPPPASAAT